MDRKKMIADYKELKKKHPDCILLFRNVDFYEAYFQDAVEVSSVVGTYLTHTNEDTALELTGFPCHALDTYLPKLIRAGKRVAIYDPLLN